VDLTLHGTYTNWGTGSAVGVSTISLAGETLAWGVDFGATDQVQLGLAMAFPINPGASFGSVLGNLTLTEGKGFAVRLDGGYESIGFNGDNINASHTNRYFGGLGAPIKIPLSPTVAFVSGRTGTIHFGHFDNVGTSGTGVYFGASGLTELSSDFLVVSGGNNNTSTNIGINLPVGLLLQPDPHFALALQAGYSAVISVPRSGSAAALHWLPVGLEAVGTPVQWLDIGARFFLDGYVAQSGGSGSTCIGYFDFRAVMLWFRFRA
jgi:hypothetical protein